MDENLIKIRKNCQKSNKIPRNSINWPRISKNAKESLKESQRIPENPTEMNKNSRKWPENLIKSKKSHENPSIGQDSPRMQENLQKNLIRIP